MAAPVKGGRILIACKDARDKFIGTLDFHFKRAGHRVDVATSLSGAKGFLVNDPVILVVIDAPFADGEKLLEYIKCRKETARVPVLQLMPAGGEQAWFTAFRFLGDVQVYQPYEVKDIFEVAAEEIERVRVSKSNIEQEVHFKFPTDDRFVDRANEIGAMLFADTQISESSQVQLCTALREALSNAAGHGNKADRGRLIEVNYWLMPDKIRIAITDQGPGFNWREFIDPSRDPLQVRRERAAQGRLGGLGIMLMNKCLDQLSYNDSGNCVTMTKMRGGSNTISIAAGSQAAMA